MISDRCGDVLVQTMAALVCSEWPAFFPLLWVFLGHSVFLFLFKEVLEIMVKDEHITQLCRSTYIQFGGGGGEVSDQCRVRLCSRVLMTLMSYSVQPSFHNPNVGQ